MSRAIYGTSESDELQGGGGSDVVYAKSGDDTVATSGSDDKVFGKSGEDIINLGDGADIAYAGQDDDFVDGEHGSDRIFGGSGDDLLYGGDVNPSSGNSDAAANSGDGIDDHIWGGTGTDEIHGQSGNDRLFGQRGDDLIYGENGSDYAHGGQDEDQIFGGTGNDRIHGGSENDIAFGQSGSDLLSGGSGDDQLSGGTGNDVAFGGLGRDELFGEAGADSLYGGSGADVLEGGTGKDLLQGDGGDDVLRGEAGDDVINAGTGHDQAFGGTADDQINLHDGNDYAVGGAGEDRIHGGSGNDIIYGDKVPENLVTAGSETIGQSIAQFGGSDWLLLHDDVTGQTTISQEIDANLGKTYKINIDVAANFAGGFTSGSVEVLWDDAVIDVIDVTSGEFATLSYEVQGAGAGTGLSIRTADSSTPASSIYDTSGPIYSYEKAIDLGDGEISVAAFAPGQAKLFQVIGGQLQAFDTATSTYIEAGPVTGVNVNAIGLNVQDDLIYGYARSAGVDSLGNSLSGDTLIMMDATGSIFRLGTGGYSDFVGDFDDRGNLWTFHTTLDHITKIDVDALDADGNPTSETFHFPSSLSTSNIYDIAYNHQNSLFYGVVSPGAAGGHGKILIIDLVNVESGGDPVISEVPITQSLVNGELIDGMASGAFGAVFSDGSGNLYAGLNNGDHDLSTDTENSGGIYRIEIDANGQFATAVLMSSAQATGNNDGAVDPRGNDPFAEIDATAEVLLRDIRVTEVDGQGWDDVIFGGDGDDEIFGGGRHDTINGGLGNDAIYGEAGHDEVFGGEGADNLSGGSGNDVLHGGADDDVLSGGSGSDALFGEAGDDHLVGGNGNDTLQGNAGADELHGDAGNDQIQGDGGNDQLFGGTGNDILNGGEGDDQIVGGNGNDTLIGGDGSDNLEGDSGRDELFGNAGNDDLSGGSGNDLLEGGNGADMLAGGTGNDVIMGGADGDTLYGDNGNDELFGGSGSDTVYGGSGADTISGGAGNDWIEAGAGRNLLLGGAGADTFVFLSNNGTHHDTVSDFQCYGEYADTLDVSDYFVTDHYENIESWQEEHITLTEDNTFLVRLGYGQSLTLASENGFLATDYDALCDTFLF